MPFAGRARYAEREKKHLLNRVGFECPRRRHAAAGPRTRRRAVVFARRMKSSQLFVAVAAVHCRMECGERQELHKVEVRGGERAAGRHGGW